MSSFVQFLENWCATACVETSLVVCNQSDVSVSGEDRALAELVLTGDHITPDIWHKYNHLVSLDHLRLEFTHKDFIEAYGIHDRTSDSGNSRVISQDALRKLIHPYAFPLMADSLRNLPPALVFTCEADTLRDDGILYAQRLRADGVKVLHHHKRDAIHGFLLFGKSPLYMETALTTLADIAHFVRRIS